MEMIRQWLMRFEFIRKWYLRNLTWSPEIHEDGRLIAIVWNKPIPSDSIIGFSTLDNQIRVSVDGREIPYAESVVWK